MFWDFKVFLKPSDDVRHICGANRDNFKHFGDTPGYISITFDSGISKSFPTSGAICGRPIHEVAAVTINPTIVHAK